MQDTPNNVRNQISRRIRELRKKRGLTQMELSHSAHLHYKYYQRLEGSNPPNLNIATIAKLAHAFDISISDFFDSEIFRATDSTVTGGQ